MLKQWFSAKELSEMNLDELPTSIQGINKRGVKEGWLRQKKPGIQGGKAFEYHFRSLPLSVQAKLYFQESIELYQASGDNNSLVLWMLMYQHMTAQQRHQLVSIIMRIGVDSALQRLENESHPCINNQ